ncbi:GNAT family N-acetyltransferase [Mycobacterium paraense]|uniref:GNAT family N-acetyltransferase, cg3035/Rv0428c family n=1 Tax=Mycobacterium paraense TaxID=767916 RepID=UPI000A148895|nr:GNAT family N-acetyltransferase [Mycobacterium paraense]MCV7445121.1 GNAT family N-acetyltransferase [Mycobacterium paraense]ORW46395.1 GCN5 family acetyltransferase [Mycobacterium paraense]
MVSWPDPGTRVTVRYRRAEGSVPPLTDAVGVLLAVDPLVRVRTKTGAVVEFAPADVVALRALTDAPVRTSDIRALERAAAAAYPGDEHTWLDGWLLRAGPGAGPAANSAMPLDISARITAIPEIVAWYERRGLAPRLAIPERLLSLPPGATVELTEQILVRDLAPGGTRWVGLSAALHEDALARAASRGATRAFVELDDGDADRIALARSLGFRLHHRRRYVPARRLDSVEP